MHASMNLRNGLNYLLAASRAIAQRPSPATIAYALRYGRRCIDQYEGQQPDFLAEAKPWMCFPAVERLDQLLDADAKVFEYGSGGSTIYFAQRAREVVSIEHAPAWHLRVQAELDRRGLKNVCYQLIEPAVDRAYDRSRIADPTAYVADDDQYTGKTFKSYAQAIDSYPNEYFDFVVVDGRARPSCILHAQAKVRPGGVLLLDQSERRYYLTECAALLAPARWSSVGYMAPLPYSLHLTEATFFTRRHM